MRSATPAASFSRADRLNQPREFAAVTAFRCRITGEYFQVYARPNGLARGRLGIVVSKRVIAQAVTRNQSKRLARDVFRRESRLLRGVDVVVRSRADVRGRKRIPARLELQELLHRVYRRCMGDGGTAPEAAHPELA